MDQFKIDAFFEQFTFLQDIQTGWDFSRKLVDGLYQYKQHAYFGMQPYLVEDVRVSRISPELLENRCWLNGATGSLVDIDESEQIFLLSSNGELLTEVRQSTDVRHNEGYTDDEYQPEETIGEAVSRLDNPNDVYHVVSYHTGYLIENHHTVGGVRVTLYKPPKGFSLLEWVENKKSQESERLLAAVAAIDAEAFEEVSAPSPHPLSKEW